MLEQTKKISFRISSVLSKVEPEPGAGASNRLRLRNSGTDETKNKVLKAKTNRYRVSVGTYTVFTRTGTYLVKS